MLDAMRVDADDLAVAVEHRSARRPGGRRRGVLDRPGDAPPAWPAEAVVEPVTWPHVARSRWRPAVTVTTTSPSPAGSSDHGSGAASPVSTSRTTRSPSTSLPVTVPWAVRPSAKRTDVVRSRRLWALVTTRPGATTKPLPRPSSSDRHDGRSGAPPRCRADQIGELCRWRVMALRDSCRLANCK